MQNLPDKETVLYERDESNIGNSGQFDETINILIPNGVNIIKVYGFEYANSCYGYDSWMWIDLSINNIEIISGSYGITINGSSYSNNQTEFIKVAPNKIYIITAHMERSYDGIEASVLRISYSSSIQKETPTIIL